MDEVLKIALPGASGRMGQAIARAVAERDGFEIVVTTKRGDDAKKLITAKPDVIIDFTTAEASVAHAELAADAGIPILIGATGHDKAQMEKIEAAAEKTAIALCPNTSFGVPVLQKIVAEISRTISSAWETDAWDVEISETHHRHKVDGPSGTALALGKAVAWGRDEEFDDVAEYPWERKDKPRKKGSIGFSFNRAGEVVGEHRVIFYGLHGEELEFRHRSIDRMVYAVGAIMVARQFIKLNFAPGLYSLYDISPDLAYDKE